MNATLSGESTSRDSSNCATRAIAQSLSVREMFRAGAGARDLDARFAATHRAESALYTFPAGQSRKSSGTPPL